MHQEHIICNMCDPSSFSLSTSVSQRLLRTHLFLSMGTSRQFNLKVKSIQAQSQALVQGGHPVSPGRIEGPVSQQHFQAIVLKRRPFPALFEWLMPRARLGPSFELLGLCMCVWGWLDLMALPLVPFVVTCGGPELKSLRALAISL